MTKAPLSLQDKKRPKLRRGHLPIAPAGSETGKGRLTFGFWKDFLIFPFLCRRMNHTDGRTSIRDDGNEEVYTVFG